MSYRADDSLRRRSARGDRDLPFRTAVTPGAAARPRRELPVETDPNLAQRRPVAEDRQTIRRKGRVRVDEIALDLTDGDELGCPYGPIAHRDRQILVRDANVVKVMAGALSATGAVRVPFMPDESGARHQIEHAFDHVVARATAVATLGRGRTVVRLRPQAVHHEAICRAALVGSHLLRVRSTVFRRPGERQDVTVEISRLAGGARMARRNGRWPANQEYADEREQYDQTHARLYAAPGRVFNRVGS
jgi:hypothetical protein